MTHRKLNTAGHHWPMILSKCKNVNDQLKWYGQKAVESSRQEKKL